jgi:hypothetical protein
MSSSRSLALFATTSLAFVASTFFAACTTADGGADTGPVMTTNPGETSSNGDGDGDDDPSGDGDPTGDGDGDPEGPVCVSALDVLFVIDNSGSMGEEQARIATAVSAIIDPLDAAGVDWRIGTTTTDNSNPWCPAGSTTPEAGKLVLSSCKSRINDFLFNNGDVDVQDVACNDLCSLNDAALQILPTPTDYDPNERARPWIEKIGGLTNLLANTDPAAALACYMPMGINGCGFESQLESAYLSLARAQNVDENEYGFLRPGASLLVIIISDEVDCSYNKDYSEIFEQDGNKVFWSDPQDSFPTSAVCWSAGVGCTGDPSGYDSCDPVNKDVNGNEGVDAGSAVLHPLSRYLGKIEDIEADIRGYDPTGLVRVSVIAGVALDGSITYANVSGTEPDFQHSFGIGPGCVSGSGTAVPPVRMRELAAQTGGTLTSVCANEYSSALTDMLEPFVGACG